MPPDDLDTAALGDLLGRARADDPAARDELVGRSMRRLEHLAGQLLRGYPAVRRWEDTADVLQNALVRLLRSLTAVTPATTREYFGLAAEQIRRELLDLVRHYKGAHGLARNYRSGLSPAPGGEGPAAPDRADPVADPEDLDRWAALHEAVGRLPVEEREAFMLVFYHGWTQPRIAELFGVDERTVRRRLRSAAEKLGEALGGRLPNGE